VRAVREGLFDYLTKPFENLEALEAVIGKALEMDAAYREIARHSRLDADAYDDYGRAMLAMSRFVDKVQGADIARGAVWLSTSDPTNELFRVDLETGEVVDLGSAGHLGGEGEGIDATKLPSGALHTLTDNDFVTAERFSDPFVRK